MGYYRPGRYAGRSARPVRRPASSRRPSPTWSARPSTWTARWTAAGRFGRPRAAARAPAAPRLPHLAILRNENRPAPRITAAGCLPSADVPSLFGRADHV